MSWNLGGWTIDGWTVLGFAGQALFSLRFIVQWISSERAKRSTIPNAFWWFSIGGGMLLFTYAAFGRKGKVGSALRDEQWSVQFQTCARGAQKLQPKNLTRQGLEPMSSYRSKRVKCAVRWALIVDSNAPDSPL